MENTPRPHSETSSVVQCQASESEALRKRCEQAENELTAIQRKNQVLGMSAPFGIFTIDPEGRVTGMNQKMREKLPWPPHDRPEALNIFEFDPFIEAGVPTISAAAGKASKPLSVIIHAFRTRRGAGNSAFI